MPHPLPPGSLIRIISTDGDVIVSAPPALIVRVYWGVDGSSICRNEKWVYDILWGGQIETRISYEWILEIQVLELP